MLVFAFPVCLVNERSAIRFSPVLHPCHSRVSARQDELTDRFRANLVISGAPAYQEDTMDTITVGDVRLKVNVNGAGRLFAHGVRHTRVVGSLNPGSRIAVIQEQNCSVVFTVRRSSPTCCIRIESGVETVSVSGLHRTSSLSRVVVYASLTVAQ